MPGNTVTPAVSELRVPTVAMSAEVTCLDGRSFRGRIFVPASSSRHDGPMRAEEWLNASGSFFPFLPDDADAPVILNKGEVLTLTVPGEADRPLMEDVDIDRRVVVECGARGVQNAKGFYEYTPEQAERWARLFQKYSYEIRALALKYPEDAGDCKHGACS